MAGASAIASVDAGAIAIAATAAAALAAAVAVVGFPLPLPLPLLLLLLLQRCRTYGVQMLMSDCRISCYCRCCHQILMIFLAGLDNCYRCLQ